MTSTTDTMSPLGATVSEALRLVQRRQELEARFRRSQGAERESVGKKLHQVRRLIRTCFR